MATRGRPAFIRDSIIRRANEMRADGQIINKSRIARELHVPLRTVFRVLPAVRGKREIAFDYSADAVAKFEATIDRTPGQGPDGDCWGWTGTISSSGYARFQATSASHYALGLSGAPRPSPKSQALHSCDNKSCVRASHLRWGDYQENSDDYRQRGTGAGHWLSDDQVREVRSSAERGCDLARRLGVSQACISNIRRGVHRAHVK